MANGSINKSGFLYLSASLNDVYDLAVRMGRLDQLGDFQGIKALYEFYTELSRDIGEPIEVDIVGWCSSWSHYRSIREAIDDLGISESDLEDGSIVVLELDDNAGYLVSTEF